VQEKATGATSEGHYEQLVRRQRAELQDTYMKGVRRLRWDAGRLAAERERRLRELLVYAADRSPFWRERLAGRDLANFTEADLPCLPILTKAEMMEEFDRVLTVPGLTRARVQKHLDQLSGDGYLDDEYRAIITSGYVEAPSLHVYGWDAFVTFVMQGSRWTGRRGEDPDAVLAQCFSCSPKHESGAVVPHRTAAMRRSPWTRSSTVSTTRVPRCRRCKGGRASSGNWLSRRCKDGSPSNRPG
jgi:phenylacetate-CoA ligase